MFHRTPVVAPTASRRHTAAMTTRLRRRPTALVRVCRGAVGDAEAARTEPVGSGVSATAGCCGSGVGTGGGSATSVVAECDTEEAVAPSVLEGSMGGQFSERQRAQLVAANPLRRLGRIDEVVAAIRYLASDAAGYTNGVILPVNGGSYLA